MIGGETHKPVEPGDSCAHGLSSREWPSAGAGVLASRGDAGPRPLAGPMPRPGRANTKGHERRREKGRRGPGCQASPGPQRPCPQSELSLPAPSRWRGARPRPLSSLPLERRARLCGCHSLSTAERERIKSRLFAGAAAALRLHSGDAELLCAARRPRGRADPPYSADVQ